MKQLPPIRLKEYYFRNIEDEINRLFYEVIYAPIVKAVGATYKALSEEIINTNRTALTDAIRSGNVWYDDGQFKGHFNAAISRELRDLGATFNIKSKTFSLPPAQLPPYVSMANADSYSRYKSLQDSMIQALDNINIDSINNISDVPDKYVQTVNWMESDFQKTVKAITIPPKLTKDQIGIIAADWGQNLDLYIKKWAKENILELRQKVQEQAFSGRRASSMVKMIQDNYQVSKRKAEFLARQETSLLMSKFREVRYKDIGATKYIWRGAMDERERPDHKKLQNKIFNWDSPPVVDTRTGRRANPGEDYGCRCVAVAVLE